MPHFKVLGHKDNIFFKNHQQFLFKLWLVDTKNSKISKINSLMCMFSGVGSSVGSSVGSLAKTAVRAS